MRGQNVNGELLAAILPPGRGVLLEDGANTENSRAEKGVNKSPAMTLLVSLNAEIPEAYPFFLRRVCSLGLRPKILIHSPGGFPMK